MKNAFILGIALMFAGAAQANWTSKAKQLENEMKAELSGAELTPERRQAMNALVECVAPKFTKLMDKFSCQDDGESIASSLEICLQSQDDARLDDSLGIVTVACMQQVAARLMGR